MVVIGLFKDHPDVPVYIGGCIDRGKGSSFRAKAHAHTATPNKGFICVRSPHRIFMGDGKRPSLLMLHELAHILTGEGHTEKWRRKLREIGGRVENNRFENRKEWLKQSNK